MAIAMRLAVGGAVLIVTLGAFAVPAPARTYCTGPPSMVLAVRAGFALLIAGLLSGAAMIARGSVARARGEDARTRSTRSAGFIKDFHGVTLHAVLVLPVLAWLLARFTRLSTTTQLTIVQGAVAAYVLVALTVLLLARDRVACVIIGLVGDLEGDRDWAVRIAPVAGRARRSRSPSSSATCASGWGRPRRLPRGDRVGCAETGLRLLGIGGNHEHWARLDEMWADPAIRTTTGRPLPLEVSDHARCCPAATGSSWVAGRSSPSAVPRR